MESDDTEDMHAQIKDATQKLAKESLGKVMN
jgi:hypothetical protein